MYTTPSLKAVKSAILPFTPNNDKRNGSSGADRLDGLSGNDTILGLGGNDTLIGSDGNDSLNGGIGNDALSGGNGRDTLVGDTGNDFMDGGADDDNLLGGSGQDSFLGGLGADTLIGGSGNDLYQVNDVSDTLVESALPADGKDSVKASVSYILPSGVENLILIGDTPMSATGNTLPNLLFGNNGNNRLFGLDGNDSLAGGAGDDTLDGGAGIDKLVGGDGSDTYVLNNTQDAINETQGGGDNDAIETGASYTLPDNVEILTLTGALAIDGNGNALDNDLAGNPAANQLSGGIGDDTLNGNAGDDRLDGGAGSDVIDGGAGNDTVRYSGALGNYDTQYDADSNTWTIEDIDNGDTDQLADVELLQFSNKTLDVSAGPPRPTLTVSGARQTEGDNDSSALQFTLTLSAAGFVPLSVDYATLNGTATAVQDYNAAAGTVTFAPGEAQKTVAVQVLGDTTVESDETFRLTLSNAQGVKLGNNFATATIANDDLPTLSIASASVTEGNGGTGSLALSVSLSAASSVSVTVKYSTSNGSANSNSDYSAVNGTLTFAPGETTKNIPLTIKGDTTVETDETFMVKLSNPANASLSATADSATVTIKNNDVPVVSIAGAVVTEGNSNASRAELTVTLSSASTQTVTVDYASSDGTATVGSDYLAAAGTLTFAPGETSKTLSVSVLGDTAAESNEAFLVALSAPTKASLSSTASSAVVTIANDDQPTLSIADVTANEGDSGSSNATVTVSLSGAASQAVTVNYATSDGTATAGSDYTAASGTLTFPAGSTSQTFAVPLLSDTTVESDETVALQLSMPSGATLSTPAGATLTIKNDDTPPPPVFSSGATASVAENTASATQVYDATADNDSGVSYSLSGTDAGKFTIDLNNGTVSLAFKPDYESPTDSGGNNVYDFTVRATNTAGKFTDQAVALTVTDVAGESLAGQAVIDLGVDYGKLINPVNVDGQWYYYWDRTGDGTSGAGYTDVTDGATHDWLDNLFRQDVDGVTGGGGNTSNTYRYATLNGVKVALPTVGEATTTIGVHPGTAIGTGPDGETNPTYDDLLAIWDAYNGGGTGTGGNGTPSGWAGNSYYWSATPSGVGHAHVLLLNGTVYDTYNDGTNYFVALQVL